MGLQGFADGSQVPQMNPGMSAYMPQEMVRRGGNRMPPGRMNPNVMNPRNMPAMPPGQMQDIRSMGLPMGGMPAANVGAGAMGAGMPGAGAMGGMSDQERAILQGLQAVGAYCAGGKA
jgi:hypothetical protein